MYLFFEILKNLDSRELKKLLVILFLIITIFLLDILSIGLFFPIISLIVKEDFYIQSKNFYFFNNLDNKQIILLFLFILIFVFLFKNIIYLIFSYLKKRFFADVSNSFSARIMYFNLHQKYSDFLKKSHSEMLRNFSLIQEYVLILEGFISLFIECVILFFIFILIIIINLKVGILILGVSLIAYLTSKIFLKPRLKKYGANINIFNEKLLQNYLDTLGSIKDLMIQKKQIFFINRFKEVIKKNSLFSVKASFLMEVPRFVVEILMVVFISFTIYFFISDNSDYKNFLVKIAFFVTLIFRAMPSVSRLIYLSNGLDFKVDLINRVNQIILNLDQKRTTVYKDKFINFKNITFKNVSFKYENSIKFNLEKINFDLKKNNSIGIVGPSGGGKSTFVDLISGLLTPTKGSILINNKYSFNKKIISKWQNDVSYISQKNFLLNSSIKDNIAFGEKESEINYEKIQSALVYSRLDEFVNSKPEGLKYIVGDNGKNLSGGQRQRLVLARSLYRDTNVILFDEATSALDKKTEYLIFNDIKNIFYGKKTLIICTHSINLLKFCDHIYKIDRNTIFKIK
jgi:ABC-type bacteriocin/lantibiotic exporter with double-glycine peptidase domain